MTKEQVKASLEVIQNLFEQAVSLSNQLIESLGDSQQVDEAVRLLEERYSVESALEELSNLKEFQDLEDGNKASYPLIKYSNVQDMADVGISIPLPDQDELYIYTENIYNSDISTQPTVQAGVMYYTKDRDYMDLCMAEIKKGDVAKTEGLNPDNRDIDIYTWADPFDEAYTKKDTINYNNIEKAFEPEQEME